MIIFDLDGTLALDSHRALHLKKDPKDWATYFSLCHLDTPNYPIHKILHSLTDYELGLWSGRSMEVEQRTLSWLREHRILHLFDEIRLRPIGDRTDDTIMKRNWLYELRAVGKDVELVFEDRQRVVDMWRAEGITCCQVAPGQF